MYQQLIYKISGIADLSIFLSVTLIIAPILNSYVILYSSTTKILYITYLHFIENQYMILALLVVLARQIILPIYNNKLLLFAKEKSIKTTSYSISWSSLI